MLEQLLFGFAEHVEQPPAVPPPFTPSLSPCDETHEKSLKQEPKLAPETTGPTKLITSGIIASDLNQPLHRVKRVLTSRPDLQPVAFAGRTRLYQSRVIARVRHELNAIDARLAMRKGGKS